MPPVTEQCREAIDEAFEKFKVRVDKFGQRMKESEARVAGLKVKLTVLLIQVKIRDEKMRMGLKVYAAMKKRNLDEAAGIFMDARAVVNGFIDEIHALQADYRRWCDEAGIPYESSPSPIDCARRRRTQRTRRRKPRGSQARGRA